MELLLRAFPAVHTPPDLGVLTLFCWKNSSVFLGMWVLLTLVLLFQDLAVQLVIFRKILQSRISRSCLFVGKLCFVQDVLNTALKKKKKKDNTECFSSWYWYKWLRKEKKKKKGMQQKALLEPLESMWLTREV